MSDELNFDAVPELKLELGGETVAEAAVEVTVRDETAIVREIELSEQEQKMVDEFVQKIQIKDANLINQYGSGAQKKIADFSENVLSSVRTKDFGEVGDMLSGVITELKGFDAEEPRGLRGLFKRGTNKIEQMKTQYDKVDTNINKVCQVLEQHQFQLLKNVALLDKMYELNKVYFKELSLYIIAGKKKLEQVRATDLKELMERAEISGRPEDAQAVNDLDALCNRFEKKLHDLELTRMISLQTAPQIRMIQNNNTMMTDKIQSTLVNTIPLWKSQMVLALGVEQSRRATAAQREVTDMTNELLRKNADTLKMSTVEIAKESERGIVDMETLQHTNQSLITTFDEVLRIQAEGREKRRQAENELLRLEGELKQKLLQINSGNEPQIQMETPQE